MITAALIRVAGYALSAVLGFVFYVGWIASVVGVGSLRDRLTAALFLCMFGGFFAALVSLTFPWAFVVWAYRKVRLSGVVFFASAGTLLMILLGSVASSVSPKPLFVEDQTFLEGVLIALQRQGICLALTGAIIGFGYWSVAERNLKAECQPHGTTM